MDFMIGSGLVTLVGLLLLARKHQIDLTETIETNVNRPDTPLSPLRASFEIPGTIKTRAIVVAILFAAAPLVQSISVSADRDAAAVFLFLGYGAASVAWLIIVLGLLSVLTSKRLASAPTNEPLTDKPEVPSKSSSKRGDDENGPEQRDRMDSPTR